MSPFGKSWIRQCKVIIKHRDGKCMCIYVHVYYVLEIEAWLRNTVGHYDIWYILSASRRFILINCRVSRLHELCMNYCHSPVPGSYCWFRDRNSGQWPLMDLASCFCTILSKRLLIIHSKLRIHKGWLSLKHYSVFCSWFRNVKWIQEC